MAADRLLDIDSPPSGALLGIGPGPAEIGTGPGRRRSRRAALRARRRAARRRRDQRQRRGRMRASTGSGRPSRRGSEAMIARNKASRFRPAAEPIEQIGLHDDGGKIIGIDEQRAIEARQPPLRFAGLVERLEQVEADRRRVGLDLRRVLEPGYRGGGIAPIERDHPQGVERGDVAGLAVDQCARAGRPLRRAAPGARPARPGRTARPPPPPVSAGKRRSSAPFGLHRGLAVGIGFLSLDAPVAQARRAGSAFG